MPHTTFSASVAALLLDVFWKSLPVFALAGLACLLLRRASAAVRHALWLLVLAGLLCLPLFGALLPRWAAPVLPAAPRPQVAAPRLLPPVAVAPPEVAAAPTAAMTPDTKDVPAMAEAAPPHPPAVAVPLSHPAPLAPRPAAADWLCLAWLVGASLVLGRTLLGLAAASRLIHRCLPVTAGPLVEAADHARRVLGLTRPLSVREGLTPGAVAVPMTCGVWRPVVLLPQGAAAWPADRLRAVLLHEAAHVRRWDWPTALLAQLVCALYWPHPLAWLAAHRLRAEAEGACDDLVLTRGGVPAPDYAAHLLEIVRGLSARRASSVATVAMASRPEVSARLRTILDARRPRGVVPRRGLVLAALSALGAVAATAAVHPVARQTPEETHRLGVTRTVVLPDGTRVDLVRVSFWDPATTLSTDFTPDGVPNETAWFGALHPNWQILRGAFASLPASEGNKGSYDYFVAQTDSKASYSVGNTQIVPHTGGRGDVLINVATGRFAPVLETSLAGKTTRIITWAESMLLTVNTQAAPLIRIHGKPYPTTEVSIIAPSRYASDPTSYQVTPLPVRGQGKRPQVYRILGGDSGKSDVGTAMRRVSFFYCTGELKADHISSFLFGYRPFHTLSFRDVALRPDESATPATSPDPIISPPSFPRPRLHHAGDPVADKEAFAAAVRRYNNLAANFYYKMALNMHRDDLAVGMPDGRIKIIRHGRAHPQHGTGETSEPRPAAQMVPDDQARFLAGLTAVQGPGIIVTLNDSKKPTPANMHAPGMEPPNLIHDTDIDMVVNELKAAGAEAISVNGERLVAVSAVRSAGPTVLVNNTAQTPPYVVRAIGDIHALQAALGLPHGVADLIRAYDPAMVKVQASAMLTLPPYRGGVPDRYARPVASADSSASLKAQEDRMVLAEINKEVVLFAYKVKHPSRVHNVKRLTDAQMLVIMREQRAKAQAKVRRDRSGMSLMPLHVNVMPRTLREVGLLTPPDLLPGLPQSPLLGGIAADGHRPQLLPSPIYRGLLVTPPADRRFSGLAVVPPSGIRFLSDDAAH